MDNYKKVKNVIHNDIGVSKEDILNVFRKIAKDEIQEIVKDNKAFIYDCIQDVIQQEMLKAISEHKYPKVTGNVWDFGRGEGKVSFKDYVSGVMKEEIVRKMEEQFKVNINIDKKK